jgi:GH15 family glucan-1,4-alpha-glucosidase
MSKRLEDYAMIGDGHTAALVASDGAIDWLCLPRFDSGACFASLLGTEENGHWTIAPQAAVLEVSRRYRRGTLVLETDMRTAEGRVRLIDFMPHRHRNPTLIRIVEGIEGQVPMELTLRLRFDYGKSVPWVRRTAAGINAVAGPNTVAAESPVPLRDENMHTAARFTVAAGERVPFVLTWHSSTEPAPDAFDAEEELHRAETEWLSWSNRIVPDGPFSEAVLGSLVALKAMIYEPSGGVVASPTTSLPEELGGSRNWDYRYSWLRDASLTIRALAENGCLSEATWGGATGSCGLSPATLPSCRSCTASTVSAGYPSTSCPGWTATRQAVLCGSATAPQSSSSSTSTARSWTPCTRPG